MHGSSRAIAVMVHHGVVARSFAIQGNANHLTATMGTSQSP
jgi:hypothetical protein